VENEQRKQNQPKMKRREQVIEKTESAQRFCQDMNVAL